MGPKLTETKYAAEVGSVRELNQFLAHGWVLIETYVKHVNGESQHPRFVVGWTSDDEPERPEFLDEWEQRELFRQFPD